MATGWGFGSEHASALPYGKLFGVWIAIHSHLAVARWFLIFGLALATLQLFWFHRLYLLNKFKHASALPGGQAEALALARDIVDEDYVVALFWCVDIAGSCMWLF